MIPGRAVDPAEWHALAEVFAPPEPGQLGPAAGVLPAALADRLESVTPERLATQYVRLFVNAMPEVPCPPYASVYLEGGVHGAVTHRIRMLYRKWGLDTTEVPDHFAVEAAFVATLLSAAGAENGDPGPKAEAAADLAWLSTHLLAWAPAFLRRVRDHDRTGLYGEAAGWALGLLERLRS